MQDPNKITDRNNGFEFTFTEDGNWIWKAIPAIHRSIEEPQIKACNEIENHYEQFFNASLGKIVFSIAKYLAV